MLLVYRCLPIFNQDLNAQRPVPIISYFGVIIFLFHIFFVFEPFINHAADHFLP